MTEDDTPGPLLAYRQVFINGFPFDLRVEQARERHIVGRILSAPGAPKVVQTERPRITAPLHRRNGDRVVDRETPTGQAAISDLLDHLEADLKDLSAAKLLV